MYNTIINISRYIFFIYMTLFLLFGFFVCLGEKNIFFKKIKLFISIQRIIIFLFIISCFSILFYSNKQYKNIDFFFLVITFITIGNFISCKIYKNSSHLLWNGIFFLLSIGIVMLYRLNPELAKRQFVWFVLGYGICLCIPILLNILPKLDIFQYFYLFVGLSLLLATLLLGKENGGAKNWLTIKGFTFQPSELVKLLFIFYLASSFCKENLRLRDLIFPSLMSMLFIICLVFQTDLGSALIFSMTYLVIIYISFSKMWIIWAGAILGIFSSYLGYKMFNHVRIRFKTWIDPWSDINNKGYQIAQSLFAICSFGAMGSGLGQGMPNKIPIVERDMIFSAFCEEFGIFFAIGLILIFIMIFYGCVRISLNTQNRFLIILSSGMTSLLCFQTFLIIGGVTKLIPLTGVTLPFVSYGGTSIIMSFVTIGILQWVTIHNVKNKKD